VDGILDVIRLNTIEAMSRLSLCLLRLLRLLRCGCCVRCIKWKSGFVLHKHKQNRNVKYDKTFANVSVSLQNSLLANFH